MLAGRLAQMVKASAKINLSVWTCLLMVWLLPADQGGFTVHRVERTDTCTGFPPPQQSLSLLHLGKKDFG